MKIGDKFEWVSREIIFTVVGFDIKNDGVYLQTVSKRKVGGFVCREDRIAEDDNGNSITIDGYSAGFYKESVLDTRYFNKL